MLVVVASLFLGGCAQQPTAEVRQLPPQEETTQASVENATALIEVITAKLRLLSEKDLRAINDLAEQLRVVRLLRPQSRVVVTLVDKKDLSPPEKKEVVTPPSSTK